MYYVTCNNCTSVTQSLHHGVPQGSVLGPKLFLMYVADVSDIFNKYQLHHHEFADDMQTYTHGKIKELGDMKSRLVNCLGEVQDWCGARRLQLNENKTELIWFASKANISKLSSADVTLNLNNVTIQPSAEVRDLGVWLDPHLSMQCHVTKTAQTCFYVLRSIRAIRDKIPQDLLVTLVTTLILSRLDYGNAVFANLPAKTLAPLQRVQNMAARIVGHLGPRDHLTNALRQLHWIPVKHRTTFKLCCMMHSALTTGTPPYLRDLVTLMSDIPSRRHLRSSDQRLVSVPRTRRKVGDQAFSVAAPTVWNDIPLDIRSILDTKSFRSNLKHFLFCRL